MTANSDGEAAELTRACRPPETAPSDALDRAAHALVASMTSGLSPASAWLAWQDWTMHMAVSPGKQLALVSQAGWDWLYALPGWIPGPVASPHGVGHDSRDPRFADLAWSAWPYSAYRDAFQRTEAWWRKPISANPANSAISSMRANWPRSMR